MQLLFQELPVGARGQYQVFFRVLYHGFVVEGDSPFYEIVDTAWEILVVDLISPIQIPGAEVNYLLRVGLRTSLAST